MIKQSKSWVKLGEVIPYCPNRDYTLITVSGELSCDKQLNPGWNWEQITFNWEKVYWLRRKRPGSWIIFCSFEWVPTLSFSLYPFSPGRCWVHIGSSGTFLEATYFHHPLNFLPSIIILPYKIFQDYHLSSLLSTFWVLKFDLTRQPFWFHQLRLYWETTHSSTDIDYWLDPEVIAPYWKSTHWRLFAPLWMSKEEKLGR